MKTLEDSRRGEQQSPLQKGGYHGNPDEAHLYTRQGVEDLLT